MKLVHPDLEQQIMVEFQRGCEWIIESPELLAKYVQELCSQTEGGEGNFVLSEEGKEINISKYMEVIVDPFSVNINDKKILNRLYAELSKLAFREDMYLSTQGIMGNIQNYFFKLEQISPYILEVDSEIDVVAILKAIGVKVQNYADHFFENLNQYIKVVAELMRKKVIVLVNVRTYISDIQMKQLLKTAVYNEIALLLIENSQRDFSNGMYRCIIDSDNCEIF